MNILLSGDQQEWPPEPLDGPAFVLMHKDNWGEQAYGRSYVFSNHAGGAPIRLINALEEAARMGPPHRSTS